MRVQMILICFIKVINHAVQTLSPSKIQYSSVSCSLPPITYSLVVSNTEGTCHNNY